MCKTTAVRALVLLFAPSLIAAPIQWRTEDGGNGHWYELVGDYQDVNNRYNWHDSKTMAEASEHLGIKGHLVTISSAAENQFLIDTFHAAQPWPTWLGLHLAGDWRWVTGESVTFASWWPGSPDNWTGIEDAALMGSQWGDHHLWNDEFSGHHAAFFVEYEPLAVPEFAGWTLPGALTILIALRRIWR